MQDPTSSLEAAAQLADEMGLAETQSAVVPANEADEDLLRTTGDMSINKITIVKTTDADDERAARELFKVTDGTAAEMYRDATGLIKPQAEKLARRLDELTSGDPVIDEALKNSGIVAAVEQEVRDGLVYGKGNGTPETDANLAETLIRAGRQSKAFSTEQVVAAVDSNQKTPLKPDEDGYYTTRFRPANTGKSNTDLLQAALRDTPNIGDGVMLENGGVKITNSGLSGQFGTRERVLPAGVLEAQKNGNPNKVKQLVFTDKPKEDGVKTITLNLSKMVALHVPPALLISVGNKENMMFKHLESLFRKNLTDAAAVRFFTAVTRIYQQAKDYDVVYILGDHKRPWHAAAIRRFFESYNEALMHVSTFSGQAMALGADGMREQLAHQAAAALSEGQTGQGADLASALSDPKLGLSEDDQNQLRGLLERDFPVDTGVGVLDRIIEENPEQTDGSTES